MNREKIIEEEVKAYLNNDLAGVYELDFLVLEVIDFLDNFIKIVMDAFKDESVSLMEQVLSEIDLDNEVQVRDYIRFYLQSLRCCFQNRWKKR